MSTRQLAMAALCIAAASTEGTANNATKECWTRVAATLNPIFSSNALDKCSKDLSVAAPSWWDAFSQDFKQLFNASSPFFTTGKFSTPALNALNNSKVCQQWYVGVEDAIRKVDPPCSIAVANATQVLTSKWNASLSEFIEASDNWAADVYRTNGITTKAPAVTATTTATPTTAAVTTTTTSPAPTPTVPSGAEGSYPVSVAVGVVVVTLAALA